MKTGSIASRWEIAAALGCAALTAVPVLRVPAGILLLCVLPGAALCRHWLGERSPARTLILGGVFSLCLVPAIGIPAALVAGRPTPALAAAAACAATLLASLGLRGKRAPAGAPLAGRWGLVAIVAVAILLQAGMSAAMHPADGVVQWKGTPDFIFFQGIYQQLALHSPPMDPENGGSLLIHNWIYHFHFTLLHLVTGLSVPASQQLAGAWMTLVLLGCAWLVAAEVLREPVAAVLACLLLMTSGEITWIARSIAAGSLTLTWPPWERAPMGLLLLIGWYNVAPLAAGLAAWYWFERYRSGGRAAALAASVSLCAAMAFFHPVLFAAFMVGFCLWLGSLALRERFRASWLFYLATPLPFILLYKLPFYGMEATPSVVGLDLHPGGIAARASGLVLWGAVVLCLGLPGLALMRGAAGPLPWIAGVLIALKLVLVVPNAHWINDWLYIALAIPSGVALVRLARRFSWAGAAAGVGIVTAGIVAFGLHLEVALFRGHVYARSEMIAGRWIRKATVPDDVLATMPNSTSIYTVVGLGHRRVAHGWTTHLHDFHMDWSEREKRAAEIFLTDQPDRAVELARRLGIRYVYVGREERDRAPRSALRDHPCFPIAFSEEEIEIRAFDCATREGETTPPAGG